MRHHGSVRLLDAPEPALPPDASAPAPTEPVFPVDEGRDSIGAPITPGEPAASPIEPPRLEPRARTARRRSRAVALASAVLVVALAFGAGLVVGRATAPGADSTGATAGGASPTPVPSSAGASPGPSATNALAGLPSDGALLGRPDAKVVLTYWADFQCPFCAHFAQDVLPQLASRIADGTLAVRHRDFVFLGPESLDAAIAVRCAGEQGKFWPMHDAVYASQAGENQGAFSVARLAQIAAGVGVDQAALAACTARHDVLVSVLADTGAGIRAGVTSTPTLDIPGQTFLGVPDPSALLAAVDAAAKGGASPTPGPSVSPSGDPWAGTTTSGLTAGAATAPVTVELWVDYQATGMPGLVQALEPGLRTRVEAGKVRLVLRDLATLGDESVRAASFVRCAAQDGEPAVWLAHDIVASAAQGANSGVFTERAMLWLGAKLGYDVSALDACMSDPATAAAVKAETATGTAEGLTATPAVIVRVGGREVARFSGSSMDATKVLAAVDRAR